MGHLLFCILHFLAIMFGFVFLFVTIPGHIIYTVLKKKKATASPPDIPDTRYKICPKCQAKNRRMDLVCSGCGGPLM